MDICFDIETMPNSGMIECLPEPEVKTGNLKDESKIAEKIAEARAEQIDRMALNPLWGRICAAVTIREDDTWSSSCATEESDSAETLLIEKIMAELVDGRIITYNGNGFDLPFLYRRAVILGIDPREFGMPTLAEMTARYNNKRHVDVMQVWSGFGNYEKLDNLGRALLGKPKLDINFRLFPELIKTEAGRREIVDYCKVDVEILKSIWNRIAGILI